MQCRQEVLSSHRKLAPEVAKRAELTAPDFLSELCLIQVVVPPTGGSLLSASTNTLLVGGAAAPPLETRVQGEELQSGLEPGQVCF